MSLISTLSFRAARLGSIAFLGACMSLSSLAYAQASPLTTVAQLSSIPVPDLAAKAWLTLDANSGQIIAANNINERVEPASLTKIMTAYVVFNAIAQGRLSLEQTVPISEKAWKTEGSRMFVKVNSQVSVSELLQGMIVQSGNDATIALAEAVAGSEEAFVALMNREAQRQGLKGTYFTNSPGLPHADHMTTVYDLGLLARNLVKDFPQYLRYYSQKEYTYNEIKQRNRNRLLWVDETVDGLKTGHTSGAGFNLIASAVDGQRRLIAVVMGADSPKGREQQAAKLLHWGQQNFDTVQVLQKGQKVGTERIWYGDKEQIKLGTDQDFWLALPKAEVSRIKAKYVLDKKDLEAPIAANQRVGEISLYDGDKVVGHYPLVTLESINKGGVFSRMSDYLHHEL